MHIYIEPAHIGHYTNENLSGATAPEIDPMFALDDPWLQSYFGLLQSEFEIFSRSKEQPDPLLLTQSIELVVRHLVNWHSNLSLKGRRRLAPISVHPLAPRHLARILAYIDANIGRDIALAELAQLVELSKDHFIRSFHAATQRTPYAYVVERRLTRAVGELRNSTMPIEQIARKAGFKSAPGFSNVFKKYYGMSPSKFRARSR
jgi:AraC family transcriptional regulator